MAYEYNFGRQDQARPRSQAQERGVGHNPNSNLNMQYVKVNDLLNYKRESCQPPSISPRNVSPHSNRQSFAYQSRSVRNAETDRSNGFLDKAFQMDELLRLREQLSKLEIENKELRFNLDMRDKELISLNSKLSALHDENSKLKQQHSDTVAKKDKAIDKLK